MNAPSFPNEAKPMGVVESAKWSRQGLMIVISKANLLGD
jgi:hypothetical protein